MPFTTTWVSDQCYLVSLMMMHSGLGSEIIKKKKKLGLSLSAFTFGPLTAEHKRNIELSSWQHPECQHRVLQMVSCAISRAKKTYWSLVFCSWLTEVYKCSLVFGCVPLTRNPWQSFEYIFFSFSFTFFSELNNFFAHIAIFSAVSFFPVHFYNENELQNFSKEPFSEQVLKEPLYL